WFEAAPTLASGIGGRPRPHSRAALREGASDIAGAAHASSRRKRSLCEARQWSAPAAPETRNPRKTLENSHGASKWGSSSSRRAQTPGGGPDASLDAANDLHGSARIASALRCSKVGNRGSARAWRHDH